MKHPRTLYCTLSTSINLFGAAFLMRLLHKVCVGPSEFDADLGNQTRASPWRFI